MSFFCIIFFIYISKVIPLSGFPGKRPRAPGPARAAPVGGPPCVGGGGGTGGFGWNLVGGRSCADIWEVGGA